MNSSGEGRVKNGDNEKVETGVQRSRFEQFEDVDVGVSVMGGERISDGCYVVQKCRQLVPERKPSIGHAPVSRC